VCIISCWPLRKPALSTAVLKSLRLKLPDCARYPRLRSMPQVVRVLGPLLVDWDILHGHVGGVLVGVDRLWWRLAAAEVVGVRQRKEGGSYLDEVSDELFLGHLQHPLSMLEDTCLDWMHLWCKAGGRHGGLQDEAKVDVPSRCRR
jgi:hypothetical protein